MEVIYTRQGRRLSASEVRELKLSVLFIVACKLGIKEPIDNSIIAEFIDSSRSCPSGWKKSGISKLKRKVDRSWYDD